MLRSTLIILFALGQVGVAVAKEPDREELNKLMSEQMDYYLSGKKEEMGSRFKAALPTDKELTGIYGPHAEKVGKLRDAFIETASTDHYWKLHAEQIRKAESIKKVVVLDELDLWTQQLIQKKYIQPNVTVLKAAGQDSRSRWESYEYAWVGGRWAMLPPTAYKVMTQP